ncbi:MAG: hypothetical protein MK052_03385 [Alphaproteobacteria bacterium]|nr:hypothetical protein [Alphaproteobacteria bacterium]
MGDLEIMRACGEASVMIMGMSFVVGSLTTVFILVLLDLYRSRGAQDVHKE